MNFVLTLTLFLLIAIAEICGCYLPYLWLRKNGSAWLLVPAAVSLMLFVWLLTLHPAAAGRTYAAYSGIYMAAGLLWLWKVEAVQPDAWDLLGAAVILLGAAIIFYGPRS